MLYATPDLSPNDLGKIEQRYLTLLQEEERSRTLDDQAVSLVRELHEHNVRCLIYSSRPEAEIRQHIDNVGLTPQFWKCLGRDSMATAKPDPGPLLDAMNELEIDPTNAIYVGDNDWDFLASQRANIPYFHAAWSGEPASQAFREATRVVQSITELRGALLPLLSRAATASVLPKSLIDAARGGSLSFYAGAGISGPSGLGDWGEHYLPRLRRLGIGHLAEDLELAELLQIYASNPTRARSLFDEFKASFAQPHVQPNAYHFAMTRASVRHVWTSNYDPLFELANHVAQIGRGIVNDDQTLLEQFKAEGLIVKMNGDFERARYSDDLNWNMVFTQEQFDLADEQRKEIWRRFEDEYRNSSIVFVGVSFQDPMLRRIVAIASRRIKRTRMNHYILMRRGSDAAEQSRFELHAENLAKRNIETIFFDNFEQVERAVKQLAAASHRPIIGFAGNAGIHRDGDRSGEQLPGAAITLGATEKLLKTLGTILAQRRYRITSGGAQGFGIPPVNAAFEVDPSLARFYVRRAGGTSYRSAPVIVVAGEDYAAMRRRFIPELRLLVAGGGTDEGVIDEVKMALAQQIPVLLLPWTGGRIAEYRAQFREMVSTRFRDEELRTEVVAANEKLWAMDPHSSDLPARVLPDMIEDLVLNLMGSSVPERRPEPNQTW